MHINKLIRPSGADHAVSKNKTDFEIGPYPVMLSRSEGSGSLGSEMLRGVYPERSEWAQHDKAVTHTDAWITVFMCIIDPRWLFRYPDEKVKKHIRRYHMRFGICASYREVATLETYPFDYLEENVQRFLIPERPQEDFEEVWQEARQLPIPIEAANNLLPADMQLVATLTQAVDIERLERYMKTVCQRAEQVGIRIIVFGSGSVRACPPDYSRADAVQQIGEHLSRWSEWAQNHSVQIVLEPLRFEETNTLNTVAEAGALIAGIDKPGTRLLADVYHMSCNNESPEDILLGASLLSHVHVAEKQERAAPGRYGEDFRPYFAALHQVGYYRRISIECNWQNLATEVSPAIETLREQWMASAG